MAKTIRLTTAQAIIKFIDNVYLKIDAKTTKFVYGIATIFGHGNVLGLGEALANIDHSLKLIQGKNEQGMAHLALGFTKQKHRRQIIACTSSVGPGAANMLTAAGTATANNLPLLLFPGDTFASRRPDPVLQQIEQIHDLNITTNDAFKPFSKFWDRINRPEQIINSLIHAFDILTDPANTGTVTICLPQDVQAEVYDFPEWFFEKRVYEIKRIKADRKDIEKLVDLIKNAQQPLVIIGGGIRYSQASSQLLEFLRKTKIPFSFTQAGKSSIPSSLKQNLGGIGVTGTLIANLYAKKADLIIGLGTKYSDFTTGSKTQFAKEAKFVNINIKSFDARKMNGLAIIADLKVALESLNYLLKNTQEFGYIKKIKENKELLKAKDQWENYLKKIYELEKPLENKALVLDKNQNSPEKFALAIKEHYQKDIHIFSQSRALYLIRKYIDPKASITAAAGSLPGDLQRLWETDEFGSYNVEYGYSCMGHEIQAAIGSSIALGFRPTYALVGDGSFLMLHSEMLTAIQEQIPVVIILFDNSGFGCINNLQVGSNIRSFETEFYTRSQKNLNEYGSLVITEFATIAKGYGFRSVFARSEQEFIMALKQSKRTKKPMLIEIKVYPKSMTPGFESFWQTGLSLVSKNKEIEELAKENEKILKENNNFN
ncbi:3D-(3,5/4)-trihydroxycyclohexane-1,2-dione acylhydrolase (decyclizing) [Mesomycoplasma hyopneumoniae]|uniref:Myo-inositol catabolism protein n=1 Tax=Mesomycoplasma hyopneumoniae (strain 7448) TaxID=262722 RepID=Q4A8D6_MESH7|nr:3D-(3,5/4)-trihydroxycyclohexane-1,2-dione acylhydrolase (decyclizing) [Mesomycoplasma hyopneumoniae]AAZ53603.1 myo-inositol catabolism protein [Mesomycoplasma hyopneumoniae 7448]AGQ50858.1 myo-inositol catabolism protein [Mesomycoplasma hyopneumoniae 7422]